MLVSLNILLKVWLSEVNLNHSMTTHFLEKGFGKLLEKKTEPSPFEGNKNVEAIASSMKDNQASEALEMQWKHAANILTRFMALVYMLAITITFFAIIYNTEDQGAVFPKPH
jgi:hypothetical protein